MHATEVKVILSVSQFESDSMNNGYKCNDSSKRDGINLECFVLTRESTESVEPLILANYGFTHI